MLEEYTDEQIRMQFDVNVFGVLDVIRATLPVFKRQRSGHFVNFSSFFGTWSMIISVIKNDNSPLRLPVGSLAAHTIRDAYNKRLKELNAWYDRSAEPDIK